MKVLIIGASGMLAKPVVRQLDKSGFQLRLFSRTVNAAMFDKNYEIINGDVFNLADLEKAINGCNAIHITLGKTNEALAVKIICELAVKYNIQLISYVSGCTVSQENRWFPMIEDKYQAEQAIINSGIPYVILRPTWFFESLGLMVRDGKAMMPGKQPNPYHWLAADDFAKMVATAYQKPKAHSKIFYTYGPRPYLFIDVLKKYCKKVHPEVKKVSVVPLGLLKLIAKFSGNKELKFAVSMFKYFQKVKEPGKRDETDELLGKAEMNFEKWAASRQ